MGVKTISQPGSFAAKFDAALKGKDIGVRTVARRVVERRGIPSGPEAARRVDNTRRMLNKYRGGVVPTPASRHEIEDAMEIARDSLKPDDDAEADQSVRRFLVPVEVSLDYDLLAEAIRRGADNGNRVPSHGARVA